MSEYIDMLVKSNGQRNLANRGASLLNQLMWDNPDFPVVPLVSNVVKGESHERSGYIVSAIEEYVMLENTIYLKTSNKDALEGFLISHIEKHRPDLSKDMIPSEVALIYSKLDWKKAITVKVLPIKGRGVLIHDKRV